MVVSLNIYVCFPLHFFLLQEIPYGPCLTSGIRTRVLEATSPKSNLMANHSRHVFLCMNTCLKITIFKNSENHDQKYCCLYNQLFMYLLDWLIVRLW